MSGNQDNFGIRNIVTPEEYRANQARIEQAQAYLNSLRLRNEAGRHIHEELELQAKVREGEQARQLLQALHNPNNQRLALPSTIPVSGPSIVSNEVMQEPTYNLPTTARIEEVPTGTQTNPPKQQSSRRWVGYPQHQSEPRQRWDPQPHFVQGSSNGRAASSQYHQPHNYTSVPPAMPINQTVQQGQNYQSIPAAPQRQTNYYVNELENATQRIREAQTLFEATRRRVTAKEHENQSISNIERTQLEFARGQLEEATRQAEHLRSRMKYPPQTYTAQTPQNFNNTLTQQSHLNTRYLNSSLAGALDPPTQPSRNVPVSSSNNSGIPAQQIMYQNRPTTNIANPSPIEVPTAPSQDPKTVNRFVPPPVNQSATSQTYQTKQVAVPSTAKRILPGGEMTEPQSNNMQTTRSLPAEGATNVRKQGPNPKPQREIPQPQTQSTPVSTQKNHQPIQFNPQSAQWHERLTEWSKQVSPNTSYIWPGTNYAVYKDRNSIIRIFQKDDKGVYTILPLASQLMKPTNEPTPAASVVPAPKEKQTPIVPQTQQTEQNVEIIQIQPQLPSPTEADKKHLARDILRALGFSPQKRLRDDESDLSMMKDQPPAKRHAPETAVAAAIDTRPTTSLGDGQIPTPTKDVPIPEPDPKPSVITSSIAPISTSDPSDPTLAESLSIVTPEVVVPESVPSAVLSPPPAVQDASASIDEQAVTGMEAEFSTMAVSPKPPQEQTFAMMPVPDQQPAPTDVGAEPVVNLVASTSEDFQQEPVAALQSTDQSDIHPITSTLLEVNPTSNTGQKPTPTPPPTSLVHTSPARSEVSVAAVLEITSSPLNRVHGPAHINEILDVDMEGLSDGGGKQTEPPASTPPPTTRSPSHVSQSVSPPRIPLFLPSPTSSTSHSHPPSDGQPSSHESSPTVDQPPAKKRKDSKPKKQNQQFYILVPSVDYVERYKAKLAGTTVNTSDTSEKRIIEVLSRSRSISVEDRFSMEDQGTFATTDAEKEAVKLSCTRLRRNECKWNGCDIIANSAEHLLNHLNSQHQPHGKKPFLCLWQQCGRRCTHREPKPSHLERHALVPLVCAYQGCDEAYRTASQLVRHHQSQHQNSALKISVSPFRPQPAPLPETPPVLPSFMAVARNVRPAPISQERHALLGPWVLRNSAGPVFVTTRYNAAKKLRNSRNSKEAILANSGGSTYAFVHPELKSTQYSSILSMGQPMGELDDIESDVTSQLVYDGLILWDSPKRQVMKEAQQLSPSRLNLPQDQSLGSATEQGLQTPKQVVATGSRKEETDIGLMYPPA